MRTLPLLLAAVAVAAACAAGRHWSLDDPGQPADAQRALLVETERHYRAGEPFDEARTRIAADPVTAWWWTRMVVRDVMSAREGKITSSESQKARVHDLPEFLADGRRATASDGDALLQTAARRRDPVEERALKEIGLLGAESVPCLIHDLARHPQSYVRQIGVDLLARVGPAALPLVERELASSPEPQQRRTAAQVVGALPPDAARDARLLEFARDPDYTVRAAAYDGLAQAAGESAATALLQRAVAGDADAFARRAAAKALAAHREPASAHALVGYLQRCQDEHDADGAGIAQTSLQRLARTRGPRSLEAWRAWAATWTP
jgi:hypothetical protein